MHDKDNTRQQKKNVKQDSAGERQQKTRLLLKFVNVARFLLTRLAVRPGFELQGLKNSALIETFLRFRWTGICLEGDVVAGILSFPRGNPGCRLLSPLTASSWQSLALSPSSLPSLICRLFSLGSNGHGQKIVSKMPNLEYPRSLTNGLL